MDIAQKLETIAQNEQKIYNKGKKTEHKAFWDAFQDYGRRTNYANAFAGYGLMGDIFYPLYDIRPVNANSMFNCMGDTVATGGRNTRIDFAQRFNDCGVEFDLSNCTRAQDIFFYCKTATRLPKLDLTKIESDAYARRLVYACSNLTKIDEIVVPKTLAPQNWFNECGALVDLEISGSIGKNGFDVHWSTRLSRGSIESILRACNLNVTESGVTVTLPTYCVDGATNTQSVLEGASGFEQFFLYEDDYVSQRTSIRLNKTDVVRGRTMLIAYRMEDKCAPMLYDDGEGNLLEEVTNAVKGSIDYQTGEITLVAPFSNADTLRVEYYYNGAYQDALNRGYNFAFA